MLCYSVQVWGVSVRRAVGVNDAFFIILGPPLSFHSWAAGLVGTANTSSQLLSVGVSQKLHPPCNATALGVARRF